MASFGTRLYGVYLSPDNRIALCGLEPGMMRGQVLVRDLRSQKNAAVDAARVLHLFTLDAYGEGSVYPFVRLRPAVQAARPAALRIAANVALPPVQMGLELRGAEFHMASGYDAPRADMLAMRKVVPGLDVLRSTFCFTLISSKRGNGECEAIYCRLWKSIVDGSLRKMSDAAIRKVANTATPTTGTKRVTRWEAGHGEKGGLGHLLHSLWDWCEDFSKWWAAHPSLRDRELRRRAATELGLPLGLGMAKFTFALELLGQNVCCLDSHIFGILVGAAKTAKEARAMGVKLAGDVSKRTAQPPEGSRWKAIKADSVALYERYEDKLVEGNEYFLPHDPMSYARCQWMTWEVLRNESTMHASLFASLRALKTGTAIQLPAHYLERLKKGAQMRWMRLNYLWVDVGGKKPVTEKAKAFAKRAKKRTSSYRYAPRLIANPVTTAPMVAAKWTEYSALHDPADRWMKAHQVPHTIRQAVLRVAYKNKVPAQVPYSVGSGAFAQVIDHPHDRKLVIKFTSDVLDAEVASRIKYLQDKGHPAALSIFPRVHEIYEVPYTRYYGGKEEGYADEKPDARMWASVLERVVPLSEVTSDTMSAGDDFLQTSLRLALLEPAMVQAKSIAWDIEGGFLKSSPSTRVALKAGMVAFSKKLDEQARRYLPGGGAGTLPDAGKIAHMIELMHDVAETLILMGFYITDLHFFNWGVRVTTQELLVIDFGLSSAGPAGKEAKTKTVLKARRPESAKQLQLFENPAYKDKWALTSRRRA